MYFIMADQTLCCLNCTTLLYYCQDYILCECGSTICLQCFVEHDDCSCGNPVCEDCMRSCFVCNANVCKTCRVNMNNDENCGFCQNFICSNCESLKIVLCNHVSIFDLIKAYKESLKNVSDC
jgi:hypothetical protein